MPPFSQGDIFQSYKMKKSESKSVSNTLVKVKTTTASPAAAYTRLRGDINFRQNTTVVQGDKRE